MFIYNTSASTLLALCYLIHNTLGCLTGLRCLELQCWRLSSSDFLGDPSAATFDVVTVLNSINDQKE